MGVGLGSASLINICLTAVQKTPCLFLSLILIFADLILMIEGLRTGYMNTCSGDEGGEMGLRISQVR